MSKSIHIIPVPVMVPDNAQHKFKRNWAESIKQWLGTTIVKDVSKKQWRIKHDTNYPRIRTIEDKLDTHKPKKQHLQWNLFHQTYLWKQMFCNKYLQTDC